MFSLQRLSAAMSPAAMIMAIVALVVAAAGAGYAAATIGTSDLKKNAVTSAKVKNGTLKAADLVKEAKYRTVTLGNGGEGDCVWEDAADSLPGLPSVASRKDRFGTTHLSGIAIGTDGPGGDAACGGAGGDEVEDYTAFTLPADRRPAATLYQVLNGGTTLLIIPGPGGLDLGGGAFIPYGAVVCAGTESTCFLDGIALETASAKVTPRSVPERAISPQGRRMIMRFLQG